MAVTATDVVRAEPDMRRHTLIKVFLTPTHLGVVTEYAREGDLRGLLDKRRRLTEGKARFLLQQLVSAVAYCHCEVRHMHNGARDAPDCPTGRSPRVEHPHIVERL